MKTIFTNGYKALSRMASKEEKKRDIDLVEAKEGEVLKHPSKLYTLVL